MFSNNQTNDMICNLADHVAENESPELYDEVLECLHKRIKQAIVIQFGFDISELYQLEVNSKLLGESKYAYKK